MKTSRITYLATAVGSLICTISSLSVAQAQVIPDATLNLESSVVTPFADGQTITGGATRGTNLFHSFEKFDIRVGESALFLGTDALTRIFARVTGNESSFILGKLGVTNSNADLVLFNNNGIAFGPDSSLSLAGSFTAATADRIVFSDGTSFVNAGNTGGSLTSSIPIGLGFGSNSAITVQDVGHTYIGNTFAPIDEIVKNSGLSVLPGQAIALIGGNIDFTGGIVRAPDSRIELASVQEGVISIEQEQSKPFNYEDVTRFGNITISSLSLLETDGFSGAQISLTGDSIDIDGGSLIFNRNFLGPSQGSINLSSVNDITISDSIPSQVIGSALLSQNVGVGKGGPIQIDASSLVLQSGGQIATDAFLTGDAGDILINVPDNIQVSGFNPFAEFLFSNISTATFGEGQAGNIQLSVDQPVERLEVLSGAQVGSATFGSGNGGVASIRADNIVVDGVIPGSLTPASINAAAFRTGDAGQLIINTGSLQVLNGARVGTSTVSLGNAGNTAIKASQFILVDGSFPGARNPSLIDSSANLLDPSLVGTLEVPFQTEGNAGNVEIITPRLTISNGGLVTVQNEGPGNAGTLSITATSLNVLSSSGISANTNGGNGGNVQTNTSNLLVADQSGITTSATGQGVGGNINIQSDAAALVGESVISADAVQGAGGQVLITTGTLFQSPDSTITATSADPDLDGVVDVQRQEETLSTESEISPPLLVPPTAPTCVGAGEDSSLTTAGRGGLPISSEDLVQSQQGWNQPSENSRPFSSFSNNSIIEARGWVPNGDGTVRFVAELPEINATNNLKIASCIN